MNELARKRASGSGIEVDQRCLGGEHLPFEDGTFDWVVSTWTLCSIPEVGRALSEVYRVRRPGGRFQKWLVTVLLNKIRDFHAARARRGKVSGGPAVRERLQEEPSRGVEEEEWDRERQRHLFRAAAERVRARTSPVHWDAFVRTALQDLPGQDVAAALGLSLTNVYAIKSRVVREIKDEIRRFGED